MIIGISGKKRFGKDLVGKIMQYFIAMKSTEKTLFDNPDCLDVINNYLEHEWWLEENGWQIVKFADKLKDMICLLIGCTREQLEDETFKNTELGEEWWQYGLIRKDCRKPILYPSKLEDIEKQLKVFEESTLYTFKPTPRYLLQFIGTDLLRTQLHPDTWVNATMADYTKYQRYERGTEIVGLQNEDTKEVVDYKVPNIEYDYPNWIITDCRFPNEVEAIKERGGIVIRVERPDLKSNDNHLSETALDNYTEFDYIINNDSTVESLIKAVKAILISEKII